MSRKIHKTISDKAEQLHDNVINTRRHFHMHPELPGEEKETSRYVAEKLSELGLEVQANIGGYGVVGILKGANHGVDIAWRADMDACAIQDEKDVPYKSKVDGVMHACGHDAHTAIALGIAEVLSSVKEHLSGTVKFIFQPWEEGSKGALAMINDGVLDNPYPSAIYGLHQGSLGANQTYMEAGKLSLHYGTVLFGSDKLDINVKADNSMNNLWALQERLVFMLNRINRYDIKQRKRDIHNLINFQILAKASNDETGEIILSAQFRYAMQEYRDEIRGELSHIIDDFSRLYNAEASIGYTTSLPPVYNDEADCKEAEKILWDLLGENLIIISDEVPPHGTDDFSLFQYALSGLFFFLGSANLNRGLKGANHTSVFDIDEECLTFGIKTMSAFLYEVLERRA